jgi:Lar family restriction alleviation protein
MQELKPCPFCGGKAVGIDALKDRRGKTVMYRAMCRVCEASSRFAAEEKTAAYIWNRRERDESPASSYKPWQRLIYL